MTSKRNILYREDQRWKRIRLFDCINAIVCLLLSMLIFFPFYQCIVVAFSDASDITMNGMPYLFPRQFSLENFVYMMRNNNFLQSMCNSLLRTLFGSLLSVFVTSSFAFAVSHSELKLRKLYLTLGLVSMYFSGGLIPTFLVIRDLGLYNNFLVYILPGAFGMYNALIFITNFRNVPRGLSEAASIDGANDIQYFFRILLPVSKPVIACILLFSAVSQWNSYYDCMIYTNDERLNVLANYFARMLLTTQYIENRIVEQANAGASAEELMAMRGSVSSLTSQMAAMVLTVAPIICLYPFLQKYFVSGIMVGSIKG